MATSLFISGETNFSDLRGEPEDTSDTLAVPLEGRMGTLPPKNARRDVVDW